MNNELEWPAINPNGNQHYNFFKPRWVTGEYSYGPSVLDEIMNDLANEYMESFYNA